MLQFSFLKIQGDMASTHFRIFIRQFFDLSRSDGGFEGLGTGRSHVSLFPATETSAFLLELFSFLISEALGADVRGIYIHCIGIFGGRAGGIPRVVVVLGVVRATTAWIPWHCSLQGECA